MSPTDMTETHTGAGAIRCPEVNLTYERRCELETGHDGWHGFMWNWNRPDEGANWWPGAGREI